MLKIIGKLNSDLQKKILPEKIDDEKVIGFFVDYSDMDIFLNALFGTIYFNESIEKVNFELIFITNELFISLDLIEKGYKTICFFKFYSIPNLIYQIPYVDNWYDYKDAQSFTIFS
ncbi:hypothetical protein D7030_08410 [Flavobacteriaceae bacterium AU392]|nr:hypothetical protein D1817_00005 [Flavobacteriaceae bacterium]RKM85141.1 hypothetical protein D7030_08410 [Flavobacteriaceae bacterium AU392]